MSFSFLSVLLPHRPLAHTHSPPSRLSLLSQLFSLVFAIYMLFSFLLLGFALLLSAHSSRWFRRKCIKSNKVTFCNYLNHEMEFYQTTTNATQVGAKFLYIQQQHTNTHIHTHNRSHRAPLLSPVVAHGSTYSCNGDGLDFVQLKHRIEEATATDIERDG